MNTQDPGGGANDGGGTGSGIGVLWGCVLSLPIWFVLYLLIRWWLS